MKVVFEKITTNIKDRNLEIIGRDKTVITFAVNEGIHNNLIVNNSSLLKCFKTEVSKLCSSIGSSLMTAP